MSAFRSFWDQRILQAAFITGHKTAFFGIEAAESGCVSDGGVAVWKFRFYKLKKFPGGCLVLAVDDPQVSAPVAVLFHFFKHHFQCLCDAAAFVQRLQSALAAGLADDADSQKAAGFGDQRRYPAVLRHVVQAFQREDEMGLLHVSTYFCLYLFKTQLRVRKDEFPQLFGDQNHFRTGGETVQTADTASGMGLFIAFLCLNGRVMAAGEGSGYGDGKHVFRIAESLQPFIDVWAGKDYSQAYIIGLLTMVPLAVPLIQSIAFSVISAQNKLKFRTIVYAVIAVLNVIGTILAMPKFGIIGAAACTAVAFIVGNGILMNWYYWKVIKLDIIGFWKNIIRISIAPVIMVVVGTVALRVITVKKLWMVLILGVMYVVLFGIASWILEMNDYEKSLVTGMFHKIKR